MNRWFFGEVLEGVERALLAAGYDLTLYNLALSGPKRDRVFDFFLARKRVDAVIAVGVDLTDREVAVIDARGKPIVALGGTAPGAPRLAIDDHAAAALATEHLIQLGHTRIAHLAGAGPARRRAACRRSGRRGTSTPMAAAGLDPAGDRAASSRGRDELPGGYPAALQLLGHPATRPTAIFAASDEIAFGAMRAADRLGIAVPADLSIIGFDGHEHAEMFGLTTIEQYPEEQGRLAVEAVMCDARRGRRRRRSRAVRPAAGDAAGGAQQHHGAPALTGRPPPPIGSADGSGRTSPAVSVPARWCPHWRTRSLRIRRPAAPIGPPAAQHR